MDVSGYKHFMWDWNGTLFDDAWLCVEVMNGVLSKRGLPCLTLETYQTLFDFPVIDYYHRLGFDFAEETFETLGTEFIAGYEQRRLECHLQPQALALLGKAQRAGITHSVLSAYKQVSLRELVTHFGLADFFLKVVGLDNHYANGKIDSAKQWIEALDYPSNEVLFIGDTVHDYEVAQAIHTDCILVASGHHTREKLDSCGVPVLASLSEIDLQL